MPPEQLVEDSVISSQALLKNFSTHFEALRLGEV